MSNNSNNDSIDTNIRIVIMDEKCYKKYCSQCPYLIKAGWSKNEGFKYHHLDIHCCVEGGKKGMSPMCPNGIAWNTLLGEIQDFDPKLFVSLR